MMAIIYGESCYAMNESLRYSLNDHSSDKVKGVDTSGSYQNAYLIEKLNSAQRYIYGILFKRIPHIFFEETTIIGVDSVFTLPSDCGAIKIFKDDNGLKIFPIDPSEKSITASSGSKRQYVHEGDQLRLDRSGVTDTYTLIYYRKPRNITMGLEAAYGAQTITLASTAMPKADYYNGMTIVCHRSDVVQWYDTIDDYSAARVATISETSADGDYYGIVPDFPSDFHPLIVMRAQLEIRSSNPLVKKPPTQAEFQEFNEMLSYTISAFGGMALDDDYENLFVDYDSSWPSIGIITD